MVLPFVIRKTFAGLARLSTDVAFVLRILLLDLPQPRMLLGLVLVEAVRGLANLNNSSHAMKSSEINDQVYLPTGVAGKRHAL